MVNQAIASQYTLAYSVPRYVQIAEGFVSQIESGELAPGDRLSPERELSDRLGVNRMTLRRALRLLELQGLLVRKHGIGTFIAEPKIDRQMDIVFRFTRGMQKRGYTPGAKVISIDQISLGAALARELEVSADSSAYQILRLRSINLEPVLLESYTIPASRFLGLDNYDLENRSIYEVMENEYGVTIVSARQSFEPVIANKYEADLLGVPVGAPLMMEKRVTRDKDHCPVEYGKDRYRGDRFRFVTEAAAPFDL